MLCFTTTCARHRSHAAGYLQEDMTSVCCRLRTVDMTRCELKQGNKLSPRPLWTEQSIGIRTRGEFTLSKVSQLFSLQPSLPIFGA